MNKLNRSKKLNFLYLTNLPAHYKLPIFEAIGARVDLEVIFALRESNWRKYPKPNAQYYRFRYLEYWSKRFGEIELVPWYPFRNFLVKNKDVVIVNHWEAPIYFVTVLRAKRKKALVVAIYESNSKTSKFDNHFVRRIKQYFFSKCDLIVTYGVSSTSTLLKLNIEPQKIMQLYVPTVSPRPMEKKMNESEEGHRYICISQLIDRKNLLAVIEAFSKIACFNDTLILIGEGPQELLINKLIYNLQLTGKVQLIPHLTENELENLYQKSHTLILASKVEVWGMVVNEALIRGLHVVVSEVCGVVDLVRDMPGVYISGLSSLSISEKMEESRDAWQGIIEKPLMGWYTTDRFSLDLLQGIFSAKGENTIL
jgi:glycosyltransferase involved in cell wall biosynthesis